MSMVSASFAPFQGYRYCIESSSNRLSGRSRAPIIIIIIFPLLSLVISGSVLGGGGLAVMKLSYQYLSICRCIANCKVCVRESKIS